MFGGKFRGPLASLDWCTLNEGAFAFKIVWGGGALKWPLKGGSRLIEVAATAGLTVSHHMVQICRYIYGPAYKVSFLIACADGLNKHPC